jgi:hypothetical protein
LNQTNAEGSVFVKFRQGTMESSCVSDSIIHDDIEPQISLSAPSVKFQEGAAEFLQFEVIETGSGISSINCQLNTTAFVCEPKTNLNLAIIKVNPDPALNRYSYLIEATDRAGNQSQKATAQFKILPKTMLQVQPQLISASSNAPDVLFVVDNSSGTMNYQFNNNFDNGFGTLSQQFAGLDWRAAVITTDPTPTSQNDALRDGQLVALPSTSPKDYILNAATVQASVLFASLMDFLFQNRSSAKQEGITSAIRAIQRSASGSNQNFFRADSHLAVVIYSDQDETLEGSETAEQKITAINAAVDATFGVKKGFSFYGVIRLPGDTMCNQNGNKPGYVYDALAQQTGGFSQNICDPDFSQVMGRIGRDINDKVLSISLACKPYFDPEEMTTSVTIKKDGVVQNVNFTISNNILKLGTLLAPGNYSLEYYCLAP